MKAAYAVVVGGINIDVCGKSFGPLVGRDSNPGTVRYSPGGVGRNVAHNLSLLGTPVFLLTALAGDGWEGTIRASCEAAGIDLSHARRVPDGTTSTYLAIEGPEGDMELALCDNALAAAVTPAYLAEQLELLNGAAAVVLDTNLTEEAIRFLAERVTAPLFADPVSVTKAEKLRPVLGRLHTLKPNRAEAELLSGIPIKDRLSLELAASKLLRTGLQRVCLSLGGDGVYCAWDTQRCLAPCPETRLVNASGGGDAMMAGFVRAFLDGLPIEASARFALACSSIAVESPETVNPALCYTAASRRAVGAVIGRPLESPQAPPVGAVTGRPLESPQAPPVGAVIGRPLESPLAPPVGAAIGRPFESPQPPPVGAVIGRPFESPQAPPVGAVTGRPLESPQPPPVGAVIGRPLESPQAPPVGAVTGRPTHADATRTASLTHPLRKQNRLEAYDYSQGGAYHIVICTEGRKCVLSEVFEGENTQQLRLYPLGVLVEDAIFAIPIHYPTVSVVRYSIMPNHVHLLLSLSTETENPKVSWVVNQLKGAVTKQAGTRIWQKGFYDQVIRTEADFRKIGEYIEYNPAKWKTDDYYVSP